MPFMYDEIDHREQEVEVSLIQNLFKIFLELVRDEKALEKLKRMVE